MLVNNTLEMCAPAQEETLYPIGTINRSGVRWEMARAAVQKNQIMESLLLAEIHKHPGQCKAALCRAVNGHSDEQLFCKYKNCYGNSWKRSRGALTVSDCRYRKPSVWRKIKNLAAAGLININREKVPDRWMSRGWDWMKVCRPLAPAIYGGI